MRLALLTSDHGRHRWFARELARSHELVLVVAEPKGNKQQLEGATELETALLTDHFASLQNAENAYFGDKGFPPCSKLLRVERGGANDHSIVKSIKDCRVEGIAVFGAGILKGDILGCCPGKIINAHQGLSPYYRGSGTNFWPFVEGKLEFVGATLHWIDEGIDTGGIICHVRPEIAKGDSMHEIGCKTVAASAQCMSRLFSLLDQGISLSGIPQWERGRLYQRSDFTAEAVKAARKKMENGLVDAYLGERNEPAAPLGLRIIELI